MAGKKVTIHFGTDGSSKIEAEGFSGGTCLDATKVFEQQFSKQVGDREMTGECNTRHEEVRIRN